MDSRDCLVFFPFFFSSEIVKFSELVFFFFFFEYVDYPSYYFSFQHLQTNF